MASPDSEDEGAAPGSRAPESRSTGGVVAAAGAAPTTTGATGATQSTSVNNNVSSQSVTAQSQQQKQQPLSCADFIQPFLKCIVSVETSGPITSQALSAVHKILKKDLIFGSDDVEKAMVVRDISEAVTMSRFEATDPDHDDAVFVQNFTRVD